MKNNSISVIIIGWIAIILLVLPVFNMIINDVNSDIEGYTLHDDIMQLEADTDALLQESMEDYIENLSVEELIELQEWCETYGSMEL